MGWYGGGGWGAGAWIGMGLGMIVFWGLVIYAIVAVLRWASQDRHRGGSGAPPPATGALQTLNERFAHGDLTEEEYQHSRQILLDR